MADLLIALGLFVTAHLVPPIPSVRRALIARLGRRAYLLTYSLASLLLLGWVVTAAKQAPARQLWGPAPWQAAVPLVVMPLALWLLIAGLSEPNPGSLSLRDPATAQGPGAVTTITRHPVLWAFLLWAASHMVPNGEAVALLLFGTVALLAVNGIVTLDRRARLRLGAARWATWTADTSVLPFAALIEGRAQLRPSVRLFGTVGATLAAYVWFVLVGHARLTGVAPLAWFGLA